MSAIMAPLAPLVLHAATPWTLEKPDGNFVHISSPEHGGLATAVWQMEDDRTDGKPSLRCQANARRIVACVNALQHISTERLESGELVNLTQQVVDLRRQLDALSRTTLEAVPSDGLVMASLDASEMSNAEANCMRRSLMDALAAAKKDGKSSARFLVVVGKHPVVLQDLPDNELARLGLMRCRVATQAGGAA